MIDLTPLEVRKKKGDFRRIMRGYDPALVDDFLDLVADRMEELLREATQQSERANRQEQQVTEYRERERALTDALVSAQEMREEVRKQTALEVDQLRKAAEREAAQVRASVQEELAAARQQATDLRAAAEREAEALQVAARREAEALHSAAAREAEQLRSNVGRERAREEQAFRQLRSKQEQFISTYRSFLERELSELGALAAAIGAAAAVESAADDANELDLTFSAAEPIELDDFAAPGDDPDAIDLAFAEPVSAADDVGLTANEIEPFEPEPLEPEDVPAAPARPAEPALGFEAGGWATPQWDGPSLEIAGAPDSIDFGADIDAPADNAEPADDVEAEDVTELLRNAAAAGYRVDEDGDDAEELLLEEELPKSDEDDGWLETLIDDEK